MLWKSNAVPFLGLAARWYRAHSEKVGPLSPPGAGMFGNVVGRLGVAPADEAPPPKNRCCMAAAHGTGEIPMYAHIIVNVAHSQYSNSLT